ncbi:uncharacterized protein METZ01_LOCUS272412, partial [marine metagenome]
MQAMHTRYSQQEENDMNAHFPHASRLIYGCMGLGGGWNDKPATKADISQARSIIDTVLSLDINVF